MPSAGTCFGLVIAAALLYYAVQNLSAHSQVKAARLAAEQERDQGDDGEKPIEIG